MLKMAKVELELIPDADLHIYFEKPTRGRVSYRYIDIVMPTISI